MAEDLTFVDRLHRDLREVHWPEPAEIRARARRRSRRTAVLSAVDGARRAGRLRHGGEPGAGRVTDPHRAGRRPGPFATGPRFRPRSWPGRRSPSPRC